ncbi:MAG: helix-turn-helix domain-containing protein [Desulfobacteraceae bacterium]|nr:helix-turn-helix domain-containing protein [Desulfobacteraceae bacterium]
MNTKYIKKAIQICGGQTALAEKIGVTQPAVHKWLNGLALVDPKHAIPIEKATNGQVTRHQIRPDIYPTEAVA